MKTRVVVMNAQRLLEGEEAGDWRILRVSKAGDLKPGIYNLWTARDAAGTDQAGPVVHTDQDAVYQVVGKSVVRHPVAAFGKVPAVGADLCISYSAEGRAVTGPNRPGADGRRVTRGR